MAHPTRIFALLLAIAAASPARAADDQTYAERQVYDPKTGTWVAMAAPSPGTEDGDLELARSLIARGEYKAARKAFKNWFKTYPNSPRRPEGLFYAADTEVSAEEAKPNDGDLMRAYNWYEELLEGWAGTELADRAIRREMIIAEMFLYKHKKQRVLGGMFRLKADEEALMMLDRIIDQWAPKTAIAKQALRLKGDYHYDRGDFDDAEKAYARLTRDFPRGKYHRFAMLRSGESALARFPGVEFDDADLLEAEVYLTDYQTQYPNFAAEADVPQKLEGIKDSRADKDYTIGRYYERTDAKKSAIYYYRSVEKNWPQTTWASLSHNRLVALGAIESDPIDEDTGSTPTAPQSDATTQTASE